MWFMFGFWIVVWVLSPFALIPLTIIYYQKYKNTAKRLEELQRVPNFENQKKMHVEWQMNQEVHTNQELQANQELHTNQEVHTNQELQPNQGVYGSQEDILQLNRAEQLKQQFEMDNPQSIETASNIYTQQSNEFAQESRTANLGRTKQRKEVDYKTKRIQGSMIVGVLLLLVSALIFATTTWQVMSQTMKVLVIGSVSIIFYAASFFSRKKFDLEMTSIAFYQLGCFFTPVTILCIGFFELFGPTFSLQGKGVFWVQFVMAIVFGTSAYIGRKIFDKAIFYYMTQASTCVAFFMLPCGLGYELRVGVFFTLCYMCYLNTRFALEQRNQLIEILQPFVMWAGILQGIYVFEPERLVYAILIGGIACVLYVTYWGIEFIRESSLNSVIARVFCFLALTCSIGLTIEDKSYSFGLIGIFLFITCLVYNSTRTIGKIEYIVSLWGIFLPFVFLGDLVDTVIQYEKSLIFTVITSVLFVITFVIILYYRKYITGDMDEDSKFALLCSGYKLPMLIVTACFGIYAMGVVPIHKMSVIAIWQIVTLFYLLRDDRRYERAFFIIGLGVPYINMSILFPEVMNDALVGSTFGFMGLAYLALGIRYFVKNRRFLNGLGTIALYYGYSKIFFEICFLEKFNVSNQEGVIIFLAAYGILIGAWLLSKVIQYPILVTPIQITLLSVLYSTINFIGDFKGEQLCVIGIILSVLFMVLGRYIKKEICIVYGERENRSFEVEFINFISISAIWGIFPSLTYYVDSIEFVGLCALTLYCFSFYKRQNSFLNVIAVGATLFWGYTAWCNQPFWEIKETLLIEYFILGVVIIITILELIKESRIYVDWIQYGLAVLCVLVQGVECLEMERIEDVLFLGIAMIFVFFYSQWKKQMRWMALSLITITILLLYMTRSFWMSITWWVYLLIAGVIFISVAIYLEAKKEK